MPGFGLMALVGTDHRIAEQRAVKEGCSVRGSLLVNKVEGNFHIAVGRSHKAQGHMLIFTVVFLKSNSRSSCPQFSSKCSLVLNFISCDLDRCQVTLLLSTHRTLSITSISAPVIQVKIQTLFLRGHELLLHLMRVGM
jgi:hypothetical protein